jgi:hypothetical protein
VVLGGKERKEGVVLVGGWMDGWSGLDTWRL